MDTASNGVPKSKTAKRTRGPLIFQIPLFGQRVIKPFTWLGAWLFAPRLMVPVVAVAVVLDVALIVAGRAGLLGLSGYHYLVVYGIVTASVLVHELGHLSACRRFRCSHGVLGFGLYMMFPVFYVDVTQTWRLPRKQRLMVDIGGVYFQLLFLGAVVLGYFTSGLASLYFAAIAINASILFNFHPVLKFDGYWVLTDALGITNLHQAAQAQFGRWLSLATGGLGLVGHLLRRRGARTPKQAQKSSAMAATGLPQGMSRLGTIVFQAYALMSGLFLFFFAWLMFQVLPRCAIDMYGIARSLSVESRFEAPISMWLPGFADHVFRLVFLGFIIYRIGMAVFRYAVGIVTSLKRLVKARRNKACPEVANS
jgi:hypothetical protein